MSTHLGLPVRRTPRTTNTRGVALTAGITATAVGIAIAVAVPVSAFAAPPTVALNSGTSAGALGTPLLSAGQLDALLDARFAPAGSAVTGQGSAVASQATALLNDGSATPSADGNVLTVNVPALFGVTPAVDEALSPIGSQMGGLNGSDGQVANAVDNSVLSINPLLNLRSHNATVTANVPINLDAAVAPELSSSTNSGAVSIDPQAGTVSVDLSKLLGDETQGTQNVTGGALSPDLNPQVEADINSAMSTLGNNVVSSATSSVENTPVNVNANLSFLSQPAGTGSSSCASQASGTTTPAAPSTTITGTGGLVGGLIGTVNNLVGGNLLGGTVGNTVHSLICALPTNLIPALLTTLSLDLGSNVGQVVEGSAPPASGSLSVLGQPTLFDTGGVNNGVGEALVNNFAGTTSTGSTGSGSSSTSSTPCSSGSLLNLCVNANLGGGDGNLLTGTGIGNLNLGGLGLGNILGSAGAASPSILGSLLNGGGNLPLGISASVGDGQGGTGTGSTNGSNLLNVNLGTGENGAGGTVTVGGPSGTNTGTGSGVLKVNVGSPSTGTGAGTGTGSGTGNPLGNLLNVGL